MAVEFDHAVTLGVFDRVGEDRAPRSAARRPARARLKTLAVEDVVAQDQRRRRSADELAADDEGLGQALGLGLNGVADRDAQPAAVAQSRSKPPMSCGVEISRMSRMPASISIDSG